MSRRVSSFLVPHHGLGHRVGHCVKTLGAGALLLAIPLCGLAPVAHAQEAAPEATPDAAQGTTPTATPDPKQPIKMGLASPFALVEKPLQVQGRWGYWLPIQVTLSNTGDPVAGRLELRLTTSSDSSVVGAPSYTEVDLPTTSNKQVWLYARIQQSEFDGGEVTFSGRGIRGLRGRFDMRMKENGSRTLLSISANGEKMSGLLSQKKPESLGIESEIAAEKRLNAQYNQYNGGGKNLPPLINNLVVPMATLHKNLPPLWVGLQIADTVVLQDFPHAELSSAQQEALRGYVAGGGTLVAIGGSNWDRLAKSPLADMWPVKATSASPAGDDQREAFVRRYIKNNKDIKQITLGDGMAGVPLMVTKSELRPGARALMGSAMPMIALHNYGAGQVVFLAGDPNQPPFAGWRGVPYLWGEVFHNTAAPKVMEEAHASLANYYNNINPAFGGAGYNYNYGEGAGGGATYGLIENLRHIKQLKTPPVSTIAWFLALYVFFLVPVNYCVLRLFDKRELAWVTVPVIVIAFSVMSYAAALRIKGNTLLARQINLVQGSGTLNAAPSGDLLARSDTLLWLFSPRKTGYSVIGDNPQFVAADYIRSEEAMRSPVTIAQPGDNKPMRIEDASVNMWDWRAFVGHTPVSVKGGVQVTTQGKKPSVKNATPFDLQGVVLRLNGRLYACGDIKAGGTVPAEPEGANTATGVQLAGNIRNLSRLDKIFPATGANLSETAGNTLSLALQGPPGNASNLLVGWSTKPASVLTIEDASPSFENATLFVYTLN